MPKKLEWKTEKRKVNDLVELEINPRKISDARKQKLIDSLDKFNLAEIPAINVDNKIIGGNQRIIALKTVGRGEELIDVRVPNRPLTEAELKEYCIISNTHAGEFDWEIFDLHFDGVDLDEIGFNVPDLDTRPVPIDEEVVEDDYEIPDEIETDIVIGDLFEIGTHRLLCGDSTDSDQVAKLMDGQKADMVFTDPPYNIQIDYGTHKDDYSEKEHEEFSLKWLNISKQISKQVLFTPGTGRGLGHPNFKMWYKISPPDWIIIWIKKNSVGHSSLGGFNNWEPIFFYGKNKKRLPQDIYDIPITVQKDVADSNGNKLHPTPKQVKLWVEVINDLTDKDNILYDPFLGSGTTLMACEKTNRKCYGMEIDPKYCQVIIDRMLKFDPFLIIKKNGEIWNTQKIL